MRTSVLLHVITFLTADFLTTNNSGTKVRFITDNARFETDGHGQSVLNSYAGELMLRYIRGLRLDKIPVLVFCGLSIGDTKYVEEFELAGSTTLDDPLIVFIEDLINGTDGSLRWAKFQAM